MGHKQTILLIDGGGRGHALYRALMNSTEVERVIWAPGNGGTPPGDCRDVDISNPNKILRLAQDLSTQGLRPDFVVIGTEMPLVLGVTDLLKQEGFCVFGPSKEAARLEGEKIFAKEFCTRQGIPTADYVMVDNEKAGYAAVKSLVCPVIKLDELWAGKGVVVTHSESSANDFVYNIFHHKCLGPEHTDLRSATLRFVFEKHLEGYERAVTVLLDGVNATLLPVAYDCKPVYLGGPNTGGMGGCCPTYMDERILDSIWQKIVIPTLRGMNADGIPCHGAMKFDLIITEDGPYLLEFNVRLGDPETQSILAALMHSGIDIVPYLLATRIRGGLTHLPPIILKSGIVAVSTVIASEGYPGEPTIGHLITGIEIAEAMPNTYVFHAGTKRRSDGTYVTSGGRVLCVTGIGRTHEEARLQSLRGVDAIHIPGAFHRRDFALDVGS